MRPKSTPSCVRHFGELSFLCDFFRMNRFKIHFRRSGCCVSWHSMLWPPHVLFGCGNVLLNEHIWLFSVSRHSYRVFEPQNTENSIALSFDFFFFHHTFYWFLTIQQYEQFKTFSLTSLVLARSLYDTFWTDARSKSICSCMGHTGIIALQTSYKLQLASEMWGRGQNRV
jgi:hypothetical protein